MSGECMEKKEMGVMEFLCYSDILFPRVVVHSRNQEGGKIKGFPFPENRRVNAVNVCYLIFFEKYFFILYIPPLIFDMYNIIGIFITRFLY